MKKRSELRSVRSTSSKNSPASQQCVNVGRGQELQAVATGVKYLTVGQRSRRTIGKVVHHPHRADDAADRLRQGGYLQPFVESAALIGFKVAESDPAQLCRVADGRHCLERRGKHF